MVKDTTKHEISKKSCTEITPTVQGMRGLQKYFLPFNSKNKLSEKTPGWVTSILSNITALFNACNTEKKMFEHKVIGYWFSVTAQFNFTKIWSYMWSPEHQLIEKKTKKQTSK